MTLTQQFLITLTLPGAFLALFLYAWRAGTNRRVTRYWLLALLTGAIWASSILSYYGGVTLPTATAFTWRVVGRYALSLLPLWLLLTTAAFLDTPPDKTRFLAGLGIVFWMAALALDPAVWRYDLPTFTVVEQTVRHFDLWAALWVTSWVLPGLTAWLLTRQASADTPSSLYRNQLNYWLLTLTLFAASGILALIQQQEQPLWQELSALAQIFSAGVGTVSLTRSRLTDLRQRLGLLGARLSSTLVIFALTWAGLWFLGRTVPARNRISTSLDLAVAAAVFAGLFMVLNRLVPRLMRHLVLTPSQEEKSALADRPELAGSVLAPETLGDLVLRLVQSNLAVAGSVLFLVEGAAGKLVLRPAAQTAQEPMPVAAFAGDGPFARHLLRSPAGPLSRYDIDALDSFAKMPSDERAALTQWQYELFIPLPAGEQLVGVLALGARDDSEPYSLADFAWLQDLARHVGPLLLQAQALAATRQINDHIFQQIRDLTREKRQLEAYIALNDQVNGLIAPELRRPFAAIDSALQAAQQQSENDAPEIARIDEHLSDLRLMLDNLINIADRVRKQRHFTFAPVRLDDVIGQVIQNLATMADARRVQVEVEAGSQLPPVYGDERRLTEAVQYLVHNAIKFNKIGGQVQIECVPAGDEIVLHVKDNGVGIPAGRLEDVWTASVGIHPDQYHSTSPGLGLFLARFIVHAHGGHVEANSEHGSGSTFSIYLPMTLHDAQ